MRLVQEGAGLAAALMRRIKHIVAGVKNVKDVEEAFRYSRSPERNEHHEAQTLGRLFWLGYRPVVESNGSAVSKLGKGLGIEQGDVVIDEAEKTVTIPPVPPNHVTVHVHYKSVEEVLPEEMTRMIGALI